MSSADIGVLNIDKPQGPSSHDVVAEIRRHTGIRRVGHAGTLDPLATGVLLICVGRATRVVSYLQKGRKEYVTTIRLGESTTTYDAEGEIVARREAPDLQESDLTNLLESFRGTIMQCPPMYSAIKHQGQPLYKLARAGQQVERKMRQVHIFDIELLQWQPPDLTLRILCSPGTYIRSIAHDLGEKLGCGAHVRALRRTVSGTWRVEDAVTLEEFLASGPQWPQYLHGLRAALSMLPPVVLEAAEIYRFALGQKIALEQPTAPGEYRVLGPGEKLVGVGQILEDGTLLAPTKVLSDPHDLKL